MTLLAGIHSMSDYIGTKEAETDYGPLLGRATYYADRLRGVKRGWHVARSGHNR